MSSDRGLTALGWLLLGFGVMAAASALPAALWPDAMMGDDDARMLGGMISFGPEAIAGRSPWWPVAIAALQIWAGLELVGMTVRYKLAAFTYGAVASVITIYLNWPILKELDKLRIGELSHFGFIGGLALSLIIPVATLGLAARQLPEANPRDLDRVFG
jgi:hypothetical protein